MLQCVVVMRHVLQCVAVCYDMRRVILCDSNEACHARMYDVCMYDVCMYDVTCLLTIR